MTYSEYINARQAEFNALPIFFAFSDKQFIQALNDRGLTENDLDQVVGLYGGGYYLKKDRDAIHAFFKKHDPEELPELMKDYDFAYDAFFYEICNHEYIYNWEGDFDVLDCFYNIEYTEGKSWYEYLHEAGAREDTIRAFGDALRKYKKDMEEMGY